MRISQTRIYLLAIALSAIASPSGRADDASEGQTLYNSKQCWQCHGYAGQGGPAARIAPTPYPFEIFARFVRYPNLMPAYSPKVLSDAELLKIYRYIKTIPEPPPREDFPELQ